MEYVYAQLRGAVTCKGMSKENLCSPQEGLYLKVSLAWERWEEEREGVGGWESVALACSLPPGSGM